MNIDLRPNQDLEKILRKKLEPLNPLLQKVWRRIKNSQGEENEKRCSYKN